MFKHLFLSLSLMLCSLQLVAQVNFKLQANGSYITEAGADYVVVPFEGKTAHEIYTILTSNVTLIFNDASKVMNTVEDNIVKVRGYDSNGNLYPFFNSHYQIEFKIRDGRVRVSAPLVEDNEYGVSYGTMVQKFLFEKGGSIKKNKDGDVAKIEGYMNSIINNILSQSEQIEEDW